MYIRYLLWNFIGRKADVQDADWTWTHTLAIPFLVGLFRNLLAIPARSEARFSNDGRIPFNGNRYRLVSEPAGSCSRASAIIFYVGSFWIYAMWIGIGVTGIMEMLRAKFAKKQDLPMQDAGQLKDREVLRMNFQ